MKVLYTALAIIGGVGSMYLGGAFMNASFDIAVWEPTGRIMTGLFMVVGVFCAPVIAYFSNEF